MPLYLPSFVATLFLLYCLQVDIDPGLALHARLAGGEEELVRHGVNGRVSG